MSIYNTLQKIRNEQNIIKDGVRIYSDGSLKIETLTEKGDMGWYLLAQPIAGAKVAFMKYFGYTKDSEYLKISDMRNAISIRDDMLHTIIEARVHRQISNDLLNR